VWRFEYHEGEDKPRKIPYYTAGNKRHGKQGSTQDLQQLTTFDAARTAAARRGFDGVGFVPLPEWNICALDFDHCVVNGELHPDLEAIVTGTYAEYSPSGTGVRAFVKGQYGNSKARGEPYGFEVFSSKGFVTFTGNRLDVVEILGNENTIAELDAPVRALCAKRFTRDIPETGVSAGEPLGRSVLARHRFKRDAVAAGFQLLGDRLQQPVAGCARRGKLAPGKAVPVAQRHDVPIIFG
jgi:primase-polymerase (primpol)-like protein